MLPEDLSCAKDTKEIIVDCCVGESMYGATRRLHMEREGQVPTRSGLAASAPIVPERGCRCCLPESWDLLLEADVTEWIKLISAQSNTVCEESSKKTISPEHVIEALKVSLYAGRCECGGSLPGSFQLRTMPSSKLTAATWLRVVHP